MLYTYGLRLVVCVRVLSMNGVSGAILSAARSANRYAARYCATLLHSAVSHQYRSGVACSVEKAVLLQKKIFNYSTLHAYGGPGESFDAPK
jgi:hypothetical protein